MLRSESGGPARAAGFFFFLPFPGTPVAAETGEDGSGQQQAQVNVVVRGDMRDGRTDGRTCSPTPSIGLACRRPGVGTTPRPCLPACWVLVVVVVRQSGLHYARM